MASSVASMVGLVLTTHKIKSLVAYHLGALDLVTFSYLKQIQQKFTITFGPLPSVQLKEPSCCSERSDWLKQSEHVRGATV